MTEHTVQWGGSQVFAFPSNVVCLCGWAPVINGNWKEELAQHGRITYTGTNPDCCWDKLFYYHPTKLVEQEQV